MHHTSLAVMFGHQQRHGAGTHLSLSKASPKLYVVADASKSNNADGKLNSFNAQQYLCMEYKLPNTCSMT